MVRRGILWYSDKNILFMTDFLPSLGLSLAIAVLVGLERESYRLSGVNTIAGLRTFIFIGAWGWLTGVITQLWGPVFFPVAFLSLIAILSLSYYIRMKNQEQHGLTTEMAAIVIFLLTALSLQLDHSIVLAMGVMVALVLSVKKVLTSWLQILPREAILATVQFAVLSGAILPFLPNQYMGPWNFFNPYVAWWMVVLVSGISFVGYILHIVIGSRGSILLSSAVGGLVSSTAVTTAMAQQSKRSIGAVTLFAMGSVIASSIAAIRVLTTASLVNPTILQWLVAPMALLGIIGALFIWRLHTKTVITDENVSLNNPFQISSAITFALLFVVISFLARSSTAYFGVNGLYFASLFAGVADVDAMTISASQLAGQGSISTIQASIAVLLVFMSNMIVKCGISVIFGHKQLRKIMYIYTAIVVGVIALAIAFLSWADLYR
jgi:uncharacterized membrane protein (DUF4010 family)